VGFFGGVDREEDHSEQTCGQRIAAGAVLGMGVGAAIGTATGDLSTGIWIGAVMGVGAAMLWNVAKGS
jgi:uncharacterized membrane protein